MNKRELTADLKKFAKKIGLNVIGFADPEKFVRFPKQNRPEKYLKNAKSVILIGIHLFDEILDIFCVDPISGKSYHYLDSILEIKCYKIIEFLSEKGHTTKIIPYNPGLFLKDSAVLAGIGIIGKNNLLITKNYGSQVRLRGLVSTAPLQPGDVIEKNQYCKDCKECINACPADALRGGYNREICLSYNLKHLKKLSDNTSIWCNICLEQCPHYKYKKF